jgi:hypothetical protein
VTASQDSIRSFSPDFIASVARPKVMLLNSSSMVSVKAFGRLNSVFAVGPPALLRAITA